MKPLTENQARSCENADSRFTIVKARCHCRCSGTLHGANRIAAGAPREDYENLPDGDHHRLVKEARDETTPLFG
jgi:hypothetical protein